MHSGGELGTELRRNANDGDEEEGDGQRWYPVQTADGASGYVQVIYTTRVEPSGPPAPPRGQPK